MAFYKRLKLPPLKLTTQSSGDGRLIYRGESTTATKEDAGMPSPESLFDDPVGVVAPSFLEDPPDEIVPSLHELQSKASVKGWEQIRSKIRSVYVECCAIPQGQTCILCPSAADSRCLQCGPISFYCHECCNLMHEKANFFHTTEQWEVISNCALVVICLLLEFTEESK